MCHSFFDFFQNITQNILFLILFFGALGGFASSITKPLKRTIFIPISGNKINLGCIGDMMIGATASLSSFFITAPNLKITLIDISYDTKLQVLSLAISAGYCGTLMLDIVKNKLNSAYGNSELVDALNENSETSNLNKAISSIQGLIKKGKEGKKESFSDALIEVDDFLRKYPDNTRALLQKARILRRFTKYEDSIECLDKALKIDPSYNSAIFNRACYKYLLLQENNNKYSIDDVIKDLKICVTNNNDFKRIIVTDKDLSNLKDNEWFKSIKKEVL